MCEYKSLKYIYFLGTRWYFDFKKYISFFIFANQTKIFHIKNIGNKLVVEQFWVLKSVHRTVFYCTSSGY
jgi:hypothetical protein